MKGLSWAINRSDRSSSCFRSWVERLLSTALKKKAFQRVGITEQFPASVSLGPQEDLLHHILSLFFLFIQSPFQIILVASNQIYLI